MAIFLAIYIYIDYRYFDKTLKWADDINQPPPVYVGKYDEIVTPTYKALRHKTLTIQQITQLNQNILWAANAFPAAVLILDKNFIIQWCNRNAKTLLGIDSKKDIGYKIFNLIRWPEFYQYAYKGDWQKPYTTYDERDGRLYHLKFEFTRYSTDNILLLCFDNTQLESLRTTQQDFVANVSHELRTPLTVLTGFLETLRDLPPEAISPEQRVHYEDLMHEQAERMLAIVTDLLTLSTLESTKLANQQSVPIASLIEQAKRQTEVLSKGQHQLSWSINPTLSVSGNAHELSSAITNLLTNAVRYTPANGQIEVFWGLAEDGQAIFSVKDSGLGIAPSDISRITERFYRVDKSRSRASGGTGLGLAITKHIAIRHNAKLMIKSKLNKGSTFSLIFPKENITSL
ncbi:phosphate regulon sensor histidine kinase PhoR [Pelistega sp. MC2]|uniref:phosphate regulon sensor histidine kinase PhoR n=1 Tax=Pelistega sp. MC2 TaxID=1720297 RepID=UPI00210D3DAB|nr:phosphate regulon sensor histidine kinase PhoR [Pelistega sp. MC2]